MGGNCILQESPGNQLKAVEISIGSTFEMSDPNSPIPHLWIVVAELGDEIVIVNINTIRKLHDPTTELDAGDHPYINRPSYVNYAQATKSSKEKILSLIKFWSNLITPMQDCPLPTLQKIQKGFEMTDDVDQDVLSFYKQTQID